MQNTTKSDQEVISNLLRKFPEGLTAAELAKKSKIDTQRVHAAVRNVVAIGMAFAVTDKTAPKQNRRSRYVHSEHFSVAGSKPPSWRDAPTFTGTDWSASTMRPGCLDHEQYGSRRGDVVVPYSGRFVY